MCNVPVILKNNFGPLRGRLGNNKIEHRNAARQTTENIMRIAQNGSVKVVKQVNMFIIAGAF